MAALPEIIFITAESRLQAGARVRCFGFAKELERHGFKCRVLSFPDIFGAAFGEKERSINSIEKLILNYKAFKNVLNSGKHAIIFLHRVNYHVFGPLLASIFKRNKVIFDIDDWNMREDLSSFWGVSSSKAEVLSKKIARRSSFCVAASTFLKEYFAPYSKKICYIPTGVDTNIFYPKSEREGSGAVTLGWIGTVNDRDMYENVRRLFDIFSRLDHSTFDISLVLAGDGAFFEKLKKDKEAHPLRLKIKFKDWIDPAKMPEFLKQIDIGLLPLFKESKFNRAKSPTKLFEYMAMEIPSVASRNGEAQNIIREGQNGLLAGTVSEFAEKLNKLLRDKDLRLKIGKAARVEINERYSLEVLGKSLATHIYHIL
ncbi:MAG TPA: glycosyltransferase family 4 protein [Candidatus Omnitrophota bacterium]|nr:glycosyltransferase family 4 protein [Candidatus Omnitrophota bacterium]